jgi:hypothetical protein
MTIDWQQRVDDLNALTIAGADASNRSDMNNRLSPSRAGNTTTLERRSARAPSMPRRRQEMPPSHLQPPPGKLKQKRSMMRQIDSASSSSGAPRFHSRPTAAPALHFLIAWQRPNRTLQSIASESVTSRRAQKSHARRDQSVRKATDGAKQRGATCRAHRPTRPSTEAFPTHFKPLRI